MSSATSSTPTVVQDAGGGDQEEVTEVRHGQEVQSGDVMGVSVASEHAGTSQKSSSVLTGAPDAKSHSELGDGNGAADADSTLRRGTGEDAPESGDPEGTTGPPSAIGSPTSTTQSRSNDGRSSSSHGDPTPQRSGAGAAEEAASSAPSSPKSRFGYVAPAATETMMLKLRKMNKDLHDAAKYNDRTQVSDRWRG